MKDGKEITIYQVRERRGVEVERKAVRGGTGGYPGRCPCQSCTPLAAGGEDGGMADGSAVDSKQYGTGCAGMARCPITEI